jgi:hypothetical protein
MDRCNSARSMLGMQKYVEYVTGAAILIAVLGLLILSLLYGSPNETYAQPRIEETKTSETEIKTTEARKTLWQKARTDPVALFTFWLVIFTAVLSGVGVIQLKFLARAEAISANSAQAARDSASIAKQSAETAEKTLLAANRAWIKVDIQVGGPITYDVNGANFTFNFILKNIGRSPATNVWVNPKIILSYPNDEGRPSNLDAPRMLRDEIAESKKRPASPLGFSIFPDDTIAQSIKTSVPTDEVERATKLIKAIYPTVYGSVEYRMGLDPNVHHTGFIFEVHRDASPRPFTTEGKKWPAAIWIEEGDVPGEAVRLSRSFLEGGYAD